MEQHASPSEWLIPVDESALSAACWVSNDGSGILNLRLHADSLTIVRCREQIIDRVARHAGLFQSSVRSLLGSMLPGAVPATDFRISRQLFSASIVVSGNPNHIVVEVSGLSAQQIKEWFDAPW